jgi:hypothetical protein
VEDDVEDDDDDCDADESEINASVGANRSWRTRKCAKGENIHPQCSRFEVLVHSTVIVGRV